MAKNGNFFMEFWPTFDIFHRLRPYLCSKREVLGFYKQVTYMRPGDEPFFYFRVHQSWLGSAEKVPFFDQKKPSMAGLLLTQPNQMETLWWAIWHLQRWENMWEGPLAHCQLPKMAENGTKSALFWPKKAKHGRLAPDSTKPNGNALMGHMTST